MKIIIGADHGGVELKEVIKRFLSNDLKADVDDVGTFSNDSVDYPDIGIKVAQKVQSGEFERGILLCGTGIGMSIVANRFPRILAALCHDTYTARMSREHNNSNILVIGGRIIEENIAKEIVKIWLNSKFQGGRHKRRLDAITDIEKTIISQ
ncbi:MAG: ribose 5-phosphate isomerase B [Thermodesulfobacteriota bacterium]|nr:ribose 5-phosphate isomerase B [Thermodesulfobacteriota bacterium]